METWIVHAMFLKVRFLKKKKKQEEETFYINYKITFFSYIFTL